MLKIRMQRTGRINSPSFRIIVTEHARSPKTGNIVEKLGTYNPKTKVRILNAERIKYWLSVGAKASGTMHNMLISAGVITGKKVNVLPRKSPPKLAPTETSEPAAAESSGEAKKEEAATAPASEAEAKPEAPADMNAEVAVDTAAAADSSTTA